MAPRKLSDADKRDVIAIYRQPGETTSTIAKHYGVSTSTISRILKTQLPEDEYRALISQKRSSSSEPVSIGITQSAEKKPKPEKPIRRTHKRSRSDDSAGPDGDVDGQLELLAAEAQANTSLDDDVSDTDDEDVLAVATELLTHRRKQGQDDDDDLDDLDDDLDDDDLDDDLDDLDDEDDYEASGEASLLREAVEIMPIADAVFPHTCYLVVDRLSELITHPLKEFAELGSIPAEQEAALTLPIFDNHRVARRFSRRNQRIIKVPDGQLITKAANYLQAKGITHLLIDGNVYSLLD